MAKISPSPVFVIIDEGGETILRYNTDGTASGNLIIGDATIQGVGSLILTQKVLISAARLKNLKASPVTIIPPPGLGKFIQFAHASFIYAFGSTPYVTTGTSIILYYSAVGGANAITQNVSGVMAGSTSQGQMSVPASPNQTPLTAIVNGAIILGNSGANDFTTGDGTLEVFVVYGIRNYP